MARYLWLDCDGYCAKGTSPKALAAPYCDGFRPRELGWIIMAPTAEGTSCAGSFYFTDASVPGLAPLTLADPSVRRVYAQVHGLPLDVYSPPVPANELFRSDQLPDVVAGLFEAAGGAAAVVVHKGGPEGQWVRDVCRHATVVNLEDHGCPRVSKIASAHSDWVEALPPPCRYHQGLTAAKGVVHCPALELALFARWVASGAILDELLE